MSSDEDFSLVMEPPLQCGETLAQIQAQITQHKKKYNQVMDEQHDLASLIEDSQETTQRIRESTNKMAQSLKEQQRGFQEQLDAERTKLDLLIKEEAELLKSIQEVERTLEEEDANIQSLRQQTDVLTVVPEKTVAFAGETRDPAEGSAFQMTSRIIYPMEGGTALITFEEVEVAQRILKMKQHQVKLGDECHITLEARPVQLVLPRLVEVHAEVCPHRVLISNLPPMDTELLLYKLELHFHKKRHGGGEVEGCEFLQDSGTVVITFQESGVAKGLTDIEFHCISLQQNQHMVRVTPFVNGKITKLQTKVTVCPRTVLLTGIPPVEQEYLSDQMEIHFQRGSNGGGEVEAFLYNPQDERATALFETVPTAKEE